MKINQEILDAIAIGEVQAIQDGLKDKISRTDPKFLNVVRRFLKDNQLQTAPKMVEIVHQEVKELPIFDDEEDDDVLD